MKIKNTAFENDSLVKILRCNKIPILMSFQIRNYIKTFQDIEKSYFEEKRKLIEKYKIKDGKENPKLLKEIRELLGIETEVKCEKFKIDIGKLPDNLFSISDIINLESFFEFVENKKNKK